MPRTNKIIDASIDEVEEAKETAVALVSGSAPPDALDLFYTDSLDEIETGLKKMNGYANKSWLLSAIILYTIVYNRSLYTQSGLSWEEYSRQARERIGLEPRDISEQLAAARFFILNHAQLERAGFNPAGSNRKLARAELATELCGDKSLTIQHLVNDTFQDFKAWYSSFKEKNVLPADMSMRRDDVRIEDGKFLIKDMEAVTVSDKISGADQMRLRRYIGQIFSAIRDGYEPAVIPVYDEKETQVLTRLRDKYRQQK